MKKEKNKKEKKNPSFKVKSEPLVSGQRLSDRAHILDRNQRSKSNKVIKPLHTHLSDLTKHRQKKGKQVSCDQM